MNVRHGARHLSLAFPRHRLRSTSESVSSLSSRWTSSSTSVPDSVIRTETGEMEDKNKVEEEPRNTSSDSNSEDVFLELEDDEYHRVILPRRPPKPVVIPWPTLLPHHHEPDLDAPPTRHPPTSTARKPNEPVVYLPSAATLTLAEVEKQRERGLVTTPCEVLHKAVQTKHWADADKLLGELEDLRIPIREDKVYVRGAIHALRSTSIPWGQTLPDPDPSAASRKLALRYLAHCPTVLAQYYHPRSILDAYRPLFEVAFENGHLSDLGFAEDLLFSLASKGLTGLALANGLFRTWLSRADVEQGYRGVTELIKRAVDAAGLASPEPETTGGEETTTTTRRMSGREYRSRVGLKLRAFKLRNAHLKTLIKVTRRKLEKATAESNTVDKTPTSTSPSTESDSTVSDTVSDSVADRIAQAHRDLDFAKRIFISGQKVGIVWEDRTKLAMLDALKTYLPVHKPYAAQRDHPDPVEYLTASINRRGSKIGGGPEHAADHGITGRQVLEVVHARANGPLNALTQVLLRLEEQGDRGSLLSRIKGRFVDSPPERRRTPWKISETTRSYWHMAHVGKLRRQQRLGEAIALFKREYLWVGLPRLEELKLVQPVPAPEPGTKEGDVRTKPKIYPSPQALNGILYVILANLDRPDTALLVNLHERYMHSAAKVDRADQIKASTMDATSHLPFVLALTRSAGPMETEAYLRSLEARGIQLGVQSWTAVATEYARQGYSRRALGILEAFRSDLDVPSRKKRVARPTTRTGNTRMFVAVAAMHYRTGRREQARHVIGLMRGRKMPSIHLARSRWHKSQLHATKTSSLLDVSTPVP